MKEDVMTCMPILKTMNLEIQQQALFEMFETYFDVDLDNCTMTHEAWIRHIVLALSDDKYLEKMMVCFQAYEDERNA